MQLIGRVVLMAFCVLAAYALPSLSEVEYQEGHALLPVVLAQFQRASAVVSPAAAVNNSQNSCTDTFTKNVTKINIDTVNQTQACYASAEATLQQFEVNVLNKTVVEVNALSKNIQMTLANCSAKATNTDTLICYLETFDRTMANLNNLTSLSHVGASSINDVEYTSEIEAKMCVNKALMGSKLNSSVAANDLQACLVNTTAVGGKYGSKIGFKSKILTLN